ncbi:outer membrane beta-barrel protein [[Flexibacter] sp. ATCC 35103]|uniref:outer membrane beta-barrel protein n=1 Tax=[Flexibacter] sp. ATCC 35103 TaxID=1937528 RepID=UPI0009D61015|nr:outer membrane beta-barrel protein [[Flexibacter] sp. ATCC 35103]OMQ11500.1 hypothetical protein BXU01_08105 [[Flexibacter] sp. ATCC 35103]
MLRLYSILLFFLLSHVVSAQDDIIIKGTVIDIKTQLPVEIATIYFNTVEDSIIARATTDKNGFFSISTTKYDKPVFMKMDYRGYQLYYEEEKGFPASKDYGKLYFLDKINTLKNVIVTNGTAPIAIKKDTLEFNASSYKVRPDSNVETLLKQLPGFDIDNNGKVTVNGKEVNQFLVNGKTFFDKDGNIAIKNLPADIIKKVQVSDFKTKKEELSKQESTSDYSSVNLTIDEKKNTGFFGKIVGGLGSDDRYESSLILNYFNNKQKISVLASSNNINSTGFSMDDVFGAMGGGRNNNGKNILYDPENSTGITQSNLIGVNYSDEWFRNFEAGTNYNFINTTNKNQRKSNQTNLLPTGNIQTSSESNTRNENTGNKVNLELDYKINPTTQIFVSPVFDQSRSNNKSDASSFSQDENGQSLNESNSKSYTETSDINFSNSINLNKVFRKSRNLSVVFSQNNSNNDLKSLNLSETIFYQDSKPNDQRNQNTKNNTTNDFYSFDFEYTEPITDSLKIRIGSNFSWANAINDEKTFNFNPDTQSYSDLNSALTNYTTSKQNIMSPKVGITWKKNKFILNMNSATAITDYDNYSLYLDKSTALNKKYALPNADFLIRYRFSKMKDITFKFDHSNILPTPAQLLPVMNLSNPLNTIIGNPDLNPIEKSSANFNFRNFNFHKRSGYSLYTHTDYYNNTIIPISVYDSSGKMTTTFTNISGTYANFIGANWYQCIKKNANALIYSLGLDGSYSFNKGYTNGVLYNAKSKAITPKIHLAYAYGESVIISPSYSLSYYETNYENYSTAASSNVIHKINLETTTYWPENFVFGNDFGYTYNAAISSDFRKDYFLWNTSLSYGILNKKMFVKVKVYDVLNQNQSAVRTISPTSIRDEENTVLKRYVMFSLSYKIGSFATSKNESKAN